MALILLLSCDVSFTRHNNKKISTPRSCKRSSRKRSGREVSNATVYSFYFFDSVHKYRRGNYHNRRKLAWDDLEPWIRGTRNSELNNGLVLFERSFHGSFRVPRWINIVARVNTRAANNKLSARTRDSRDAPRMSGRLARAAEEFDYDWSSIVTMIQRPVCLA